VIKKAQEMVLVDNPVMRRTAARALEKVASKHSGPVRSFVEYQKKWVRDHRVYGGLANFN
jgi:hypothetical protein